jgi:RNA polymerase sigma-70 factor (ECF subfamily)
MWLLVSLDPKARASAAMGRYATGDDAAFAELYEALSPRLYGFLVRLSGDVATAEDLLQQTFLQMHEARSRFAHGADVTPWAMAIARRLFIDVVRRNKTRATDLVDTAVLDETNVSTNPTAEDWLVAHETEAVIESGLAMLPSNQRDAFQLVKQEGLSIAEAASVLGITATAVKLRAHRAYVHLRAALDPAKRSS